MTARSLMLVAVLALLFCGEAVPAGQDRLKSGPQVGDNLPGPFHSLVAYSGEEPSLVGKKTDFTEMYGQGSVVLVFARQMTDPLAMLVKRLDAEAGKHAEHVLDPVAQQQEHGAAAPNPGMRQCTRETAGRIQQRAERPFGA